jgi:nitrogen-specific signal transduction histidine kinase
VRQAVDLHEGLDNTLVIFRAKLKDGVDVHRDYSAGLPPVPAYGSELNLAD